MRLVSPSDARRLRTAWAASCLAAATAGALAHAAWSGAIAAAAGWAGAAMLALMAAALVQARLRRVATAEGDAMTTLPMAAAAGSADGRAASAGAAEEEGAGRSRALGAGSGTSGTATAGADRYAASRLPALHPQPWPAPARAQAAAGAEAACGEQPSPTPAADASVPAALADALRQAIEARELRLVYQPMIDLRTRRVQAVEALLRWPRAVQALLPTVDIVDVAERAGLGSALGLYVMDAAFQQMARWQQVLADAAPQRVSINLTRSQCLDPELPTRLHDMLRARGLRGTALQIELTAAVLAGDDELQRALRPLRATGVAVALDRFGEGASSLADLRELPIDLVKVDRGIVQRAEAGGAPRLVLDSTLRVAASLGLPLVAEGVETRGQLDLLHTLGIGLAQGHALCAPVDAFSLTRRLRSGACLPRGLSAARRSAPPQSA